MRTTLKHSKAKLNWVEKLSTWNGEPDYLFYLAFPHISKTVPTKYQHHWLQYLKKEVVMEQRIKTEEQKMNKGACMVKC